MREVDRGDMVAQQANENERELDVAGGVVDVVKGVRGRGEVGREIGRRNVRERTRPTWQGVERRVRVRHGDNRYRGMMGDACAGVYTPPNALLLLYWTHAKPSPITTSRLIDVLLYPCKTHSDTPFTPD